MSETDAEVQNDVGALAQYITLPTEPETVYWVRFRSDTNPLLTNADYRIIAVLQYDAETVERLHNEVLYLVRNNLTINEDTPSAWFPEALITQLHAANGQVIPTYQAKPFYKAPYGQGSVYFMGEYVIIEMRTETW